MIAPSTISIHSALLVKTNGLLGPADPNDRVDLELVHRVDLGFGRHVNLLLLRPVLRARVFEIRITFLTPTPKPMNINASMIHGSVPNQLVQAASRSSRRRTDMPIRC